MIKGKAEIKFGTGDIRTTSLISENIGIYVLENSEPHEIGDTHPVEDSFTINGKPVMITFSKVESIDVVIQDLLDIKQIMIEGVGNDAKTLNTSISDFWKKDFKERCFA